MKNFKLFNVTGTISNDMEMAFMRFITETLNSDPTVPVVITINSSGGSVINGISMYNILKSLPNPVYTLITGQCSSTANLICLATNCYRRFAFENTAFYAHAIHCNVAIEGTKILELKEIAKTGEKQNEIIRKILETETSIPSEKLMDIYTKDGEITIYPEDFKKLKIAQIIDSFEKIFEQY